MKKLNASKLLASFVLIFFSGSFCSAQKEYPAHSQTKDEITHVVLDHHLEAVRQNDLEAVMADYTDESIIITPEGTLKGLEEIRAFFIATLPAFPTEGTTLTMDKTVVEGEIAFIIWHADTPVLNAPFGTDTFIVQDGKITIQTFAAVLNPKESGSNE